MNVIYITLVIIYYYSNEIGKFEKKKSMLIRQNISMLGYEWAVSRNILSHLVFASVLQQSPLTKQVFKI